MFPCCTEEDMYAGRFFIWDFTKIEKDHDLANFVMDLYYNRKPSDLFCYLVYVDRVVPWVDARTFYKVYSVDYPGEVFLMAPDSLKALSRELEPAQDQRLRQLFILPEGASAAMVEKMFTDRGSKSTT